ncbi:cation diffusion facilitator family transporter [Desulforhabdus sp. TSK]|uniref:cation diffusion facilitator family transporter n=1 Tax=Desulforhabdus sp. TSK TaxID=2925014 RepID=UPI001FC8C219|nr:cation diffusion facilitator family transporter [Desulforhabdus sp. TSK]GKT07824.1 cation transporter [Desulforhabdus sp. TSK]
MNMNNADAWNPGSYFRHRLIAITFSLVVGALLMASKFYVYWLTHSSAILSDALESIINVVASAFAMGSILLASKPPDMTHPYGHGKIEFFSAGFEGALIVFAAIGIARTAWPQILHPHPLPNLESGLWILLATSAVNFILGAGLVRIGKRTHSLTLVADGKHVMTDVYTSAGVLLGLVLVNQTGWYWMDGAIACLVALNILVMGGKLINESFSGLMDRSDPGLLEDISKLLAQHRRDVWIDIHHLRAWRSGDRIHLDFHLILPRDLSLDKVHQEVEELQALLSDHFNGRAETLIHAEPCNMPQCPICGLDPCELRVKPTSHQALWHREVVTLPEEGAGRLDGIECGAQKKETKNSAP